MKVEKISKIRTTGRNSKQGWWLGHCDWCGEPLTGEIKEITLSMPYKPVWIHARCQGAWEKNAKAEWGKKIKDKREEKTCLEVRLNT